MTPERRAEIARTAGGKKMEQATEAIELKLFSPTEPRKILCC
jgi:hypothetical protein